jgi:hypothetical protein
MQQHVTHLRVAETFELETFELETFEFKRETLV